MDMTWIFLHGGESRLQKIAISGIMDLVSDMYTYANREIRPNTFGMQFPFLYLY